MGLCMLFYCLFFKVFTTANPDVAKLFRRKFSFLENDFAFYRINEIDNNTKIVCEEYSLYKEEAEFEKNIIIFTIL